MSEETRPEFKCSFKPNKPYLIQSCRRMVFHITDAQAIGYFVSIFVLFLLSVLPEVFRGNPAVNSNNATVFWILVVALAALILMYYILPPVYANAALSKLQAGKSTATIYMDFYLSSIHIRNSAVTGKSELSYDMFTRCADSRDLIFLQNRQHQTLVIPKAEIVGGNEFELKKFLQKRCRSAKIQWKKVI